MFLKCMLGLTLLSLLIWVILITIATIEVIIEEYKEKKQIQIKKKENDKMEETRKFHVGDLVVCINSECSTLTKNEIYVITDISNQYIGFENNGTDWEHRRFELVSPHLTPKFNVGDKVVYGGVKDPHIVKKIQVGYELEDSGGFVAFENDLELYEEPKIRELTMEQLEKDYGCKVKVVK